MPTTQVSAEHHGPDASAEREGFEAFVHKHLDNQLAPVAQRYALYRKLPAASAMDIVATALTRIWEHGRWPALALVDEERRLATIYRYMRYVALEHQKVEGRSSPVAPADFPDRGHDLGLEEQFMARSALVTLGAALRELPPEQREVIELAGIAGLTVAQISAATGTDPGTISSWLYRGRQRLKSTLGAELLAEFGISRVRRKKTDVGNPQEEKEGGAE